MPVVHLGSEDDISQYEKGQQNAVQGQHFDGQTQRDWGFSSDTRQGQQEIDEENAKPLLTELGKLLRVDPKMVEMGGLWYLPGMNRGPVSEVVRTVRAAEIFMMQTRASRSEKSQVGREEQTLGRVDRAKLSLLMAHRLGHLDGLRNAMLANDKNPDVLISAILAEQTTQPISDESRIRQVASLFEAANGDEDLTQRLHDSLAQNSHWGDLKTKTDGLALLGIAQVSDLFPGAQPVNFHDISKAAPSQSSPLDTFWRRFIGYTSTQRTINMINSSAK